MPIRPDDHTFLAPQYDGGSFGWARWPNPDVTNSGGYVYSNDLNGDQPGWPGVNLLLNRVLPSHVDDDYFGAFTARDVGTFDYESGAVHVHSNALTDSSGVTAVDTATASLYIRGSWHRWGGADPSYRKFYIQTGDENLLFEPATDDFEITLPLTADQATRLSGLGGTGDYAWTVKTGEPFTAPSDAGYYGLAIWKLGVIGDFTFGGSGGTGGGGTGGGTGGDGTVHESTAKTKDVARVVGGFNAVAYPIALGLLDSDLEEGEGTLSAFVQGCLPTEDVTFAYSSDDITFTDLYTATADDNGNVGPMALFIPADGVTGVHYLRATATTSGTDATTFTMGGFDTGADPGVDAAPVLVAGSNGRWVFQDLMPGGIGSWVMPVNPTSMTNPHLTKAVTVGHTTSPNTGQYHLAEGGVGTNQWTLAGYCPDEHFHDQLRAYEALNRRIYVIDHRGRAWKCSIEDVAITPRKRQLEDNGTPQDWAADYRINLTILDQNFLAVT